MSSAPRLRLPAVAGLTALAGLFSVVLVTSPAQSLSSAQMGRIHGRVINPAGMVQKNGTVSLSIDGGVTLIYNFPVSSSGEYSGQAPAGDYMIVYRAPDTPQGKIVDYVSGVEVVAGQDTAQNIDMTRPEFIARLSPEQQRQLQGLKQANASAAVSANLRISTINSDLRIVDLDFEAAENAGATATQNLGAGASQADVDAMTAQIKNARLTEVETLTTKDASSDPDEPTLWVDLARAEAGLKNYLDAETHYKKALDLALKANPARPKVLGAAYAGLGEVYARTLMVDDANAAFNAAARADPSDAAAYFRNQAVIFYQEKNFPAQVDAAETAIKADPSQATLYYILAEGLAQNATVDLDTNKIVFPPGCIAAFHKYLELAPTGPFAANAIEFLQKAGEATSSTAAPSTN